MAKNVLPVDFQDDILSEDMDGRRKYQMITNADGTVSFVDVTEYTQVGSNFGQAQINATNEAVNESADKNKIIDTKADLMANTQAGMIAGASAVKAAVSELTENLKWKLFGSRTGSNRLGIKELVDAGREIKVVVEAQYSSVGERTKFVFYLLPSEDIKGTYSSGYCFSSTNYASVSIGVSSDLSVLIMPSWWKMVENASNTIALNDTTATLKVYYR